MLLYETVVSFIILLQNVMHVNWMKAIYDLIKIVKLIVQYYITQLLLWTNFIVMLCSLGALQY